MKKRFKMTSNRSKKLFTRTADRVQKFNLSPAPLRGGIRM